MNHEGLWCWSQINAAFGTWREAIIRRKQWNAQQVFCQGLWLFFSVVFVHDLDGEKKKKKTKSVDRNFNLFFI